MKRTFEIRIRRAGPRLWPKSLSILVATIFLCACHAGGNVTATPSLLSPHVASPTIAVPSSSPYYSNTNSIAISGMCNSGDLIQLQGASSQSQVCSGAAYSFSVSESTDGIYSFSVNQTDESGNGSSPALLTWVRQTSIAAPTITLPSASPYLSALASLTVAGGCETGATVTLSGGATATQTCVNSQYSFSVPKSADGDYTIQVNQTDQSGNTASASVVWKKHALTASPAAPTLLVGTSQIFTITGGSGSYSLTMLTNNSGGTLDTATSTYTVGPVANVVDTLQITDSLGTMTSVDISTVPGAADHLNIIAGNNLTSQIGLALSTSPKVQVVDQYGNGVGNISVYFHPMDGDAAVTGNPIVVTDSSGFASIATTIGYNYVTDTIFVAPAVGVLPDAAGTGHATVTLTEKSSTNAGGSGTFGLSFSSVSVPAAMVTDNFGTGHTDNKHRDIAVVNSGGSNIGVLLNKGNGLYRYTSYSVCSGPVAITTGDFNGDGIKDIAVACSSGFISTLMGNSDGSFQASQSFVTDSGPVAIVAADFNGDGKIDLAIASSVQNNIGIHLGNGNGSFQIVSDLTNTTGLSPVGLVTTDLNKDGYADLVVLSQNNLINVLINKADGSGTFAPNVDLATGNNPSSIAVGDFNSDTWPDIAVSNTTDATVSVFLNDRTGNLTSGQTNPVGNNPGAIVAADLQGTGYAQDIAIVNAGDSDVGILLGTTPSGSSSVTFNTMLQLPFLMSPTSVLAADTNGDGVMDIIADVESSPGAVQVLPGLGGGAFGNSTPVANFPVALASGHFINSSTNLDLAVVNQNSNTVTLLKGTGNGLFGPLGTLNTGSLPVAVAVADFNLDGNLDLAVVNQTSKTVSIFLGHGDGTFNTKVDYPLTNAPKAIVIQDFNGDGFPDLAIVNYGGNSVSILLGVGDGTFRTKVDYPTGQNPVALASADFNGDGKVDLAVVESTSNTVGILLGNGDGTFQSDVEYPVGTTPASIFATDFNGDGYVDLAVVNNADASVSILQGVGNGSFTAKTTISVGGGSMTGIAGGDFYGNGKVDLAISNGDNTFAVLKGTGSGTFASPVTFSSSQSGAGFQGIIATDVNNDGILDLILTDVNDNTIETWMGQ